MNARIIPFPKERIVRDFAAYRLRLVEEIAALMAQRQPRDAENPPRLPLQTGG